MCFSYISLKIFIAYEFKIYISSEHWPYMKQKKEEQIELVVAVTQWLACWPCNPKFTGLILRSSSLLDELTNRDPLSMT